MMWTSHALNLSKIYPSKPALASCRDLAHTNARPVSTWSSMKPSVCIQPPPLVFPASSLPGPALQSQITTSQLLQSFPSHHTQSTTQPPSGAPTPTSSTLIAGQRVPSPTHRKLHSYLSAMGQELVSEGTSRRWSWHLSQAPW